MDKIFSKDWFLGLDSKLREMGLDSDDKSFDEIKEFLSNPPILSPDEFASAVSYVILASGFNQKTAKKLHRTIMPLMCDGIDIDDLKKFYKNELKLKAIIKVWNNRKDFCDNYYKCKNIDEKINYLRTIPFVGEITVNHLARNLGENLPKYDRWIQRLGVLYSGDKSLMQKANSGKLNPEIKKYCDDMFDYLHNETGLPIGYIDVVLFKSSQNKLIKELN